MSLFTEYYNKIFKSRQAETIVDRAGVGVLHQQQLMRNRQDILSYRQALQAAEQVVFPSRLRLLEIYQQIDMDAHLTAVVSARRLKAVGQHWRLVSASGEQNVEAEAYLRGAWFRQFLEHAFDSILYGFSLVQLEGIDADGMVSGVSLVPRQLVKPESGQVVALPAQNAGVSFEDDEWVVPVGRPHDLGLYSKAAPYCLYKANSLQAQAQFVELFGMPLRIGRVNAGDAERARAMYRSLTNMNGAGVIVLDHDDQVEFQQAGNSGVNGAVYQALIGYLDEQISKLVLGQTMTADSGSSRSQAEVHERVADVYLAADLQLLTHAVNDELLPRLAQLGIPVADLRFEFFEQENTDELLTQVMQLLQTGQYTVPAAWLSEKLGIPLEAVITPPAQNPTTSSDDTAAVG